MILNRASTGIEPIELRAVEVELFVELGSVKKGVSFEDRVIEVRLPLEPDTPEACYPAELGISEVR
jgi:hypothetical protein